MPRYSNSGARSDYDPQGDALMKAAQSLQMIDQIDAMSRRDQQMQMQAKGLELENERIGLANVEAQRRQDEDAIKLWNKSRSETAASYAAAEVPKINLDHPDGEKQLGNWMSYAQAEGVTDDSIKAVFEPRLRELGVKKEYRARAQVEALGAEGIELYDAFIRNGIEPARASRLAIKSEDAKKTLAYWQTFAEKKGTAFIPDLAKVKKRVGAADSAQINENTFDATPYFYDSEALYAEIASKLSPELKTASELEKRDKEAKIIGAEADAVIKTKEAGPQGDIRKNAAAMGQIATSMQFIDDQVARDNAASAVGAIASQFPGATQGAPANPKRAEKTKADGF